MADPGLKIHDVRIVVTQEGDVDHIRKQIRDASVGALGGLVPGVLEAVEPGKVHPSPDEAGTRCAVYTGRERVLDGNEFLVLHGGEVSADKQFRSLELVTAIQAKVSSEAATPLVDELDAAALEVERALIQDAVLAGLLQSLDVVDTATELEGDADKPVGTQTITWAAVYRCTPADPSVLA